jgi:hypothetical protein
MSWCTTSASVSSLRAATMTSAALPMSGTESSAQ